MNEKVDLRDVKVKVENLTGGIVGYNSQNIRAVRTWTQKGQILLIPANELEEVLYEEGIKKLFTMGYLGITNPDHRKLIGLDNELETVVPFTDEKADELISDETSVEEFEEKIENIQPGEKEVLVDRMLKNKEKFNYSKAKALQKRTGVNVQNLIINNFDEE